MPQPWFSPLKCTHRDGVGVINLKLGRLLLPVAGARGEQVEEHLEQVEVLACDVGDLEYRAHPGGGGVETEEERRARGEHLLEQGGAAGGLRHGCCD